jgi:hypothetical protein
LASQQMNTTSIRGLRNRGHRFLRFLCHQIQTKSVSFSNVVGLRVRQGVKTRVSKLREQG